MQIISYLQVPKKTLCTYYKIIHLNLLLFENFTCCKHPRLKSKSNHHFTSYCKRFKYFLSLFTVLLCLTKLKKKGKSIHNTWTKGKEIQLKKKVNVLLHFESVNLSTNKNTIHSTFPQKVQYFFRLAKVSSCLT